MKSYNLLLPDKVSLYFEVHGKGVPLLLIAGLGSDSQSWGAVVQNLAQDFMVITPDNRGVGRSTQKDVKISIPAMADDCMAILDYLEIPAIHLAGHSMGGFVALECAMRYSQRVCSLVLAATSTKSPGKSNSLFRLVE
jgi:pimeloyl-ACP methyl ester carboxylesterase